MKKNGITLVALVITITIMIILATTSISLAINKRYFPKTDEMNFSANFDNYKNELEDYIGDQDVIYNGRYNQSNLFADNLGIYYNGEKIMGKTIKDIISTISDEYINDIKIFEGKLVYVGDNENYRNKVNGSMPYSQNGLITELRSSMDNMNAQDAPIAVEANIDGDFSVELVYMQMDYSYKDGINNFIHSDGFMIYETSENGDIYYGLSSTDGEQIEFATRIGKTDKISFTYDSEQKLGTIYINGEKVSSKIFTTDISYFNKIYISGDREYYSLRVYDKCLNYSEIKQNDIKDIVMYGAWEEK